MSVIRGSDQDGAVLVEFAGVLVLFMILLWGILTYGMVFAINHSLSNAAAEAARASIGAPDGAEESTADTVAANRLSWLGSAAGHATVDSTVAGCADMAGDCVTVEVHYPYGAHPVIPGLGLVPVPDDLSSQATVSLS